MSWSVDRRCLGEPRVLHRKPAAGDGQLADAIHATQLGSGDERSRIEAVEMARKVRASRAGVER